MLEKINKPNDIHKIALADFPQLADEIRQFLIGIFKLCIAGNAVKRFIKIALSAEVDDIVGFDQLRQQTTDRGIDRAGTGTSADNQDNRFGAV